MVTLDQGHVHRGKFGPKFTELHSSPKEATSEKLHFFWGRVYTVPCNCVVTITNSDLNSPCFVWHPYGKLGLFKIELVIADYLAL